MSYKGTPLSSQIIWLEQRVKQLEFGPGGIMEMKQTIADKEIRIEKLESALRILANITDCDTEGKLPVDTKLTWARQKLFDVRQLARKALDAE